MLLLVLKLLKPLGVSGLLPPAAAAVDTVAPAVLERAAPDGVDDDDEGEEDDVDAGHALPVPLERGHHAGLARPAAVADLVGVVAPLVAVRVGGAQPRRLAPPRAAAVREVAARGRLAAAGLDRGEVVSDELRPRLVPVLQAPANVGAGEAAPDLVPVLAAPHVAPQPRGVVPEAVLPVPAAGDGLAGATVGDGKGEGGEAEEGDDEGEHGEQHAPSMPAMDSAMRSAPSAMAGDVMWRSHSPPSPRVAIQIPPPRMGAESSSVTRLSAPITLLLSRNAMAARFARAATALQVRVRGVVVIWASEAVNCDGVMG